jgi:uncharacterized protein HemX
MGNHRRDPHSRGFPEAPHRRRVAADSDQHRPDHQNDDKKQRFPTAQTLALITAAIALITGGFAFWAVQLTVESNRSALEAARENREAAEKNNETAQINKDAAAIALRRSKSDNKAGLRRARIERETARIEARILGLALKTLRPRLKRRKRK